MPDIREVLNSLSADDKQLWSQYRTEMRRTFISAHNAVLGCNKWDESDDIFMDYIDIKLALLFDKSGRMVQIKTVVEPQDAVNVEEKLAEAEDKAKEEKPEPVMEPSEATKSIQAPVWGQPNKMPSWAPAVPQGNGQ